MSKLILWIFIGIIILLGCCIGVLIYIICKFKKKGLTSVYSSRIVHDLKTPLYAIDGFTMLASKNLNNSKKIEEYLDKISNVSKHMLALVNDVIQFDKFNTGKTKIEISIINLEEMVNKILLHIEPQMLYREIKFEKEIKIIHRKVLTNELYLTQILINLLSNAIKYTESRGQIFFKVIETSKEKKFHFSFQVQDTGCGMSEEFQKRLFIPFSQERNFAHTDTQSSGLGLFLVKKYVDILHGKIEVKSVINEGSSFIVHFEFDVL